MAVNTYKAQLNYYDHTYGWGNVGTCAQGDGRTWGAGSARTGVMYFPGLSNLKGKIINSVKITVTNRAGGQNAQKTAHFFRSASQGGINTSLGAGHKTGNQIGTLSGWFHAYAAASLSFTPTFFSSYIAAGEDTFYIYSATASEYLVWGVVTLEVAWQEPATQPTLSEATVEMGKSVTINTPAVNSAYRHTLRYAFGKATGTIAENVASSKSWTPPVSLASRIPDAASGIGTIYCDTYSGSTLLGTKSVSITLTIPSSVVPSAGKLTAAVTEDTSGTGQFVRGMGKAAVSLSGAAGVYGSTIKSYSVSGGGWSSNESTLTTGILQAAGEITFTAVVTDSRGRTAQTTCQIEVIAYDKPGISSLSVYRCDSTGAKKNAGTYAAIEIKASYSAITGNTVTLKAAYKLTSDASYGNDTVLTNSGKTVIGGALSASHTYDVRITVADKFNTATVTASLRTKNVIWSVLPKGLGFAIGKVAELANWLDVAWDTRIRGNLQVDGTISSADQYRIKWQTIPDGADLNDETYRMPGYYRSTDGKNNILNAPQWVQGAFEMVVTGIADGTYCTQTVKDYRDNYRYVRTQTTWTTPWSWTSWTWYLIPSDLNSCAKLQQPNNLIHTGNEFTFVAPNFNNDLWLNYRTASGSTDGNIGTYLFGNGKGDLAYIKANGIYADTLGWKTLWSGKLTSGSITITGAKKYAAILVSGHPGSEAYRTHICLPTGGIDGQMVTNMVYMYFVTTYSGDDCTITLKSNPSNGNIDYVWGIVQWKG